MIKDFTPCLQIKENIEIIKERSIPKDSHILVKRGDVVKNNQVISKILKSQEVYLEKISENIGLFPSDIENSYLVHVGDYVKKGEELLKKQGLFKIFNTTYKSKHEGKIEFISKETGTIGIRPEPQEVLLKSYLSGIVVDIKNDYITIKSISTYIQGIFGIGGERELVLKEIKNKEDIKNLKDEENICYFCNFFLDTDELIQVSKQAGGIIIPSISSSSLKNYLGYDISIPITGNEETNTTIIITEGFGEIFFNPKIYEILKKYEGCDVSINGATQIRAGAVRPEIIIFSKDNSTKDDLKENTQEVKEKKVRILRDPYFGKIGVIKEVLKENYKFENGVEARAVVISLDNEDIVIPKANIEIL